MGKIKAHPPVKYFAALTYHPDVPLEEACQQLSKLFSEVDLNSEEFRFSDFTSYYESEMGSDLRKKIISFRQLQPADELPELKQATNRLEEEFQADGRRRVNIDPGYVTAAKVVLATTKDYDHRLYLGGGIFGDLHMRYRSGRFHPSEWAYPDYRQPEIIDFFHQIRETYLNQLKNWAGPVAPQNNSSLLEES